MTRKTGFVIVSTTVARKAEAEKLANLIVGLKLAACVQYMPIRSVYRWKGAVESGAEFLLLAKTTASASKRLVSAIKKNHAYEVPEILVTPVTGGFAGYLSWISEETRST